VIGVGYPRIVTVGGAVLSLIVLAHFFCFCHLLCQQWADPRPSSPQMSHLCRVCWATLCAKAEMMGVQPLPLQIENVSAIMSAFKAEATRA
jgi:hypothetical protein